MNNLRWMSVLIVGVMMIASVSSGAPMRTDLTRENRLPDIRDIEVSLMGSYQTLGDRDEDFEDNDITRGTAELRMKYGVNRDFALTAAIPAILSEMGPEDEEFGMGDVRLGFELRAFEHPYDLPYVLPYLEVAFPTGDEDKGHGTGDVTAVGGAVVGTEVYEFVRWGLDIAGVITPDDVYPQIGTHVLWELSPRFFLLSELQYTAYPDHINRNEILLNGGMVYKPHDLWQVGFYAGCSLDGEKNDNRAALRITRTFDDR